MILLFCLQRPDVFSYGDLAILRSVRMVYRHKELPRERWRLRTSSATPASRFSARSSWFLCGQNKWLDSARAQVFRLDKLIKNLVEWARTEETVKEEHSEAVFLTAPFSCHSMQI